MEEVSGRRYEVTYLRRGVLKKKKDWSWYAEFVKRVQGCGATV